jgi:hypothetical protein
LVNANRTVLVVFTRKRKLPDFFEPIFFFFFFGVTMQPSMLVKYLGVVLDSRLFWMEHVSIKVKKACNLFWACRRAYGATWLYVSIIRPSITFASLVWGPGCQTASAKKRQSRMQRLVCLGIMRALCTTATVAMEAHAFLHLV